ncbi:SRPBCC family protein [Companilactobacillus muriivasis]|uniref:SRPBCC family protein n=1 Tax=Companilactobacillus muriivasis TaxID=3081444 RepID=UPI0030C7318F
MKKLFKNEILIEADKNTVKKFLVEVPNFLKWNWAIGNIKEVGERTYAIHRDVDALNKDEIVEVKQNNSDEIIFQSTTGTLEYQLVFKLSEESGFTRITEQLYPTNVLKLPLALFAPIVKNAFNQNLHALKSLLELQVTKM